MRRVALALALTAALARPAGAATYWCSPTGTGGASGADSAANATTLAWFLANHNAGDVALLKNGNYGSVTLAPRVAASAGARFSIVGNVSAPAAVVIAGSLLPDVARNDYLTLKGVKLSSVDISSAASGSAVSDSIVSCVIDSSLGIAGAQSCVVSFNRIGSGTKGSKMNWADVAGTVRNYSNVITDNVGDFGIGAAFGGNANAMNWSHLAYSTVARNVFYVHAFSDNNVAHLNTWYDCMMNAIYDNKWIAKVDAGSYNPTYMLNVRDSTWGNVWTRDTLLTDTTSTAGTKIEFMTSGAYPNTSYSNTYSRCVFHTNGTVGYQVGSNYDLHEFNQYVSKSAFTYAGGDTLSNVTFRHCTFVTTTGIVTDHASDSTNATAGRNLRWVSNIFLSTNATPTTHNWWKRWTGWGYADSNLYWSAAATDSGNRYDYQFAPNDARSKWANPQFANWSWGRFDLRPATNSLAFSSNLWPDGYVGAVGSASGANAIVLGSLQTYANMHAVSVYLPFTGDANANAVARLFVTLVSTGQTDSGVVADTCLRYASFCASALWLQPGTTYRLCLRVVDPDGVTDSAFATVTTRAFTTATAGGYVYVDYVNGNDGTGTGTLANPFKTLQTGWANLSPTNNVLFLKSGPHYDSLRVNSGGGSAGAPYLITGAADAWLDGSDEALLTPFAWDSVTVSGKKVYRKVGIGYSPRLLACDSIPLFRHYSFKALVNDSTPAPAAGFFRSLTNDTLYVQLEDGSNPANHVMHFGKRTHLVRFDTVHDVVLQGLNVRYSGNDGAGGLYNSPFMFLGTYWTSSIAAGALQLHNVQRIRVTDCRFYNNGLAGVVVDSIGGAAGIRDVTVDNCSFYDSRLFAWGEYPPNSAVSGVIVTPHHHPALSVFGGRGVVLYRNYFTGHFDCIRLSQEYVGKMLDVDIQENRFVNDAEGAIEVDPVDCANLRVIGNTIRHVCDPLDCDMYFGPMYYVRNVVSEPSISAFHIRSSFDTLKTWPTVHVYHNTFASASGVPAISTDGGGQEILRGWKFRNNVIATTALGLYSLRWYESPANDVNWNLFASGASLARLRATTYALSDTALLRARGLQSNGRFANSMGFADSARADFRPLASSAARDRGARIPGINTTPTVRRVGTPDLGHYEYTPPLVEDK